MPALEFDMVIQTLICSGSSDSPANIGTGEERITSSIIFLSGRFILLHVARSHRCKNFPVVAQVIEKVFNIWEERRREVAPERRNHKINKGPLCLALGHWFLKSRHEGRHRQAQSV